MQCSDDYLQSNMPKCTAKKLQIYTKYYVHFLYRGACLAASTGDITCMAFLYDYCDTYIAQVWGFPQNADIVQNCQWKCSMGQINKGHGVSVMWVICFNMDGKKKECHLQALSNKVINESASTQGKQLVLHHGLATFTASLMVLLKLF